MPTIGRTPEATHGTSPTHDTTPPPTGRRPASTQKQETLDALKRSRVSAADAAHTSRPRAGVPARATTVPVHVREENPAGDGIIVTLRNGHWREKSKPVQGEPRVQVGLDTGKTVAQATEDRHIRAGLLDRVEIDGETVERGGSARVHAQVLATQLRKLRAAKPGAVTVETDPRTPAGAAWLRGEWAKVCDRVTDPASKPRQEVIDWIISGDFPGKTERSGQDTYWEHIFLRYCGGDFLPLDLERNYSKDLRWAYIGEWNASGRGHPAIHTSATLLNDKLAGTGYDVYDTKFMPVGDRLCVTELWGYRDDEVKNNQVTDGVDTFWIENGEITHKMISLTVTDADGDPREYYRKIGQPFPPDLEFARRDTVD